MRKVFAGAAIAALVSTSLSAQTEAAHVEATAALAPAPALLSLNNGTPITLAVAEEVNSSTHEEGDTFRLTVLNDVMIGNTVVIPRGTPAMGEITWRTGKGAFGKSGKLELSLRHIDLGGQRIPVSGDFRQEGEGNTIATGIGILAVGVFAGFITGKRARLPVGRELMAQLAQPVPFRADGRLDTSFDSAAAVTTAEMNTPLGQCRAAARALERPSRQEDALEECYKKRME
jgi:hypothetical protein